MAILQDLSAKSHDELVAMVQRMQASSQRKLTLKVSDKGAVSLYGLGRFPVTLYGTQWERLLSEKERIADFLKDNASLLSTKD